jgi:hypothetical protein
MSKSKTVTKPYRDTRKRVLRNGEHPWAVTLYDGAISETKHFHFKKDADELFRNARLEGYEVP